MTLSQAHSLLAARSDVEPVNPAVIPLFVEIMVSGKYSLCVVLTIQAYDILTCLSREIKYFASTPQNPTTWLYYINRYLTLVATILFLQHVSISANTMMCRASFVLQSVVDWITMAIIDYILLLRVLALYSQGKQLKYIMYTWYACSTLVGLGLLIRGVVAIQIDTAGIPGVIEVCATSSAVPSVRAPYWFMPSIFELILMCLALFKAFSFWKVSRGMNGLKLIKVLIQDQAIYFILVLICSLTNAFSGIFENMHSTMAGNLITNIISRPALLSVLGSHLMFHLKELRWESTGTYTTTKVAPVQQEPEISRIQFV